MDDKQLLEEARKVLMSAYAPYSKVQVGAAVLAEGGQVYTGCNVENSSYGLTICAERAAIFAAVAAGHRKIKAVAIAAKGMDCPRPCGACLQVMEEFQTERVLVQMADGGLSVYGLKDLLPRPFKFGECE
jgi:cytidine deaminase